MFRFIENVTKCRLCVLTDQCKANLAWARRKPMLIQSACWLFWKRKDMIKPYSSLYWLIYWNLFYEVPRSYTSNCMGVCFFRCGLPPHTLIMNRLPSRLNIKDTCRSLSAGVAFTFRHAAGKSSQKRKGRDLQTLPTLLDVGYSPFFLYSGISLLPHSYISILSYRCILV